MLTTTLSKILSFDPCCPELIQEFIDSGIDLDQELSFLTILDNATPQNTLWCLRAASQDSTKTSLQIAIRCAESVLPIWSEQYPDDNRPALAIAAAKAVLDDPSDENKQAAARGADAAWAADAKAAAWAAARAAKAAAWAADAAADADAAWAAADAAATRAADAADAARAAADFDLSQIVRDVLLEEGN